MNVPTESIAVVGMSARFPDAPDYASFWKNLSKGLISITNFTNEQLLDAGLCRESIENPAYVPAKPLISNIDLFDSDFFGFSNRDAALTDPQHRIFLELAWEAFEDAGYEPGKQLGRIGVFTSVGKNTYLINNLLHATDWPRSPEVFQLLIGNEKDYLATRVAHLLDAQGPSINIQTACSSSLVAVHLACQSLLMRECDFAIAGGVSISVPNIEGYWHQPYGILSPTGKCEPFSPSASGVIFGDGAAAVVLRRSEDAQRDTVRAWIRGSASNNDGQRASFSAPSESGQTAVIAEALTVSNVEPAEVGYVETHGTATILGDSIEMRALDRAFQPASTDPIAIGSVKANIGHSGAAAGIAGLCKTVLACQHGVIPPVPYVEKDTPIANEATRNFYLNSTCQSWPKSSPFAAVSSFGQGGANAHVVIERAKPLEGFSSLPRTYPFLLSARSKCELEEVTQRLIRHIESERFPLESVAWTLFAGRRAFKFRRCVLGSTRDEVMAALRDRELTSFADAHVFSEPKVQMTFLPITNGITTEFLDFPEYREAAESLQTENSMRKETVAQLALAQLWLAWGVLPHAIQGIDTGSTAAEFLLRRSIASARSIVESGERLIDLHISSPTHPEGKVCHAPSGLSLRPKTLAATFAQLWLAGVRLSRDASLFPQTAKRVPLPTYPFQRKSHWVAARSPKHVQANSVETPKILEDLESQVRSIFATTLGKSSLCEDDNFFSLGGTSLSALAVIASLERLTFLSLGRDLLFRFPTPKSLAAAIRGGKGVNSTAEEIAIKDISSYVPKKIVTPRTQRSIFLTGASGFLGVHLLEEILLSTNVPVTCLVRSPTIDAAHAKLKQVSDRFDVCVNMDSPRLQLVIGDLSKPRLGLDQEAWSKIVAESSDLIHSASEVNFIRSYETMRLTNVVGCREALDLADSGSMNFHLTSSVAVFECETYSNCKTVFEDEDLSDNRGFLNGYDLSKWASEEMTKRRKTSAHIYRLSNVAPHSERGIEASNQILTAFLQGCVELGFAPGKTDRLNVIPVDIAAKWIIGIVAAKSKADCFHIVHPRSLPVRNVIQWLNRRGHSIEFCAESEWRERIRGSAGNSFFPFLPLLEKRSLFSNREFDLSNVQSVFGDDVLFQCPILNETVLNRYYRSIFGSHECSQPFPDSSKSKNENVE